MNKQDYISVRGKLQVHAGADKQPSRKVAGYYSLYNQVIDADWCQMMIMPGAYAKSVKSGVSNEMRGTTIKWLYQHNPENVLGSVKAGTFKIKEDGIGLFGEGELPEHDLGDRILVGMQRGDIDEASVGFYKVITQWEQGDDEDMIKIIEADLFECTVANFPKNPNAQLSLMSDLVASELPEDVESKPVLRALNRFAQKLDPTAEDKEVLQHYRSVLESRLNPELLQVLNAALSPAKDIFVPVEVVNLFLDTQ